ncbi:31181_t:CDS:1, partial [Gigaspora margarita]
MYNSQLYWVDESFSSNQKNIPFIKVPFPPMVNPEELVTRQRKVKSKIPTKPPNAFLIYRMQYIKELHNRNYYLCMRNISSAIANSWKNESEIVIEHYENIAREANKIFKIKFPKPPTPQKISVSRHSKQKTVSRNSQQKTDIYKSNPPYPIHYIPQQLPNNSLG